MVTCVTCPPRTAQCDPTRTSRCRGRSTASRPSGSAISPRRLIVDREIEIEAFRTQEYWSVDADVSAGGDPFLARLVKHQAKRLGRFDLPDEATATAAREAVRRATFTVAAVEKKPARRSP